MSRRTRSLIIGCAAVALLAVLLLVLTLWTPAEPDDDSSPTPLTDPTGTLLDAAAADTASVLLQPKNGQSFTIHYKDNAYSLSGGDKYFPDNISALSGSFTAALGLKDLRCVDENADSAALASYALDAPALVWRVTMKDGSSHEFALGGGTVTGSGYYIRAAGGNRVYLLSKSNGDALLRSREEYYRLGFIPAELQNSSENNVTWNKFDRARLVQQNRVLDFEALTEEQLTSPDNNYFSSHRMTEPHDASINEYSFTSTFMNPITTIAPSSVVEVNPADLSLYGLDKPDILTLSDTGDWTGTLLIGGVDPDSGGRYVMHEGVDVVLLDTKGNYGFLTAEEYLIRLHSIWLHNIDTVASVDFELDGVSRHLELGFDPESLDCDGTLDGKSLSSQTIKRLYQAALQLMSSENYFDDIPDTPPRYRITLHFLNGSSSVLELYAVNERQYVAVLDGKSTEFLVYHTVVQQKLLDRISIVDNGGEL